jgi:hypothetical protein
VDGLDAASDFAAGSPTVELLGEGVSNIMVRKTHNRVVGVAVLAYGILALASGSDGIRAAPGDKKDSKEQSTQSAEWVRKEGELKIAFDGKGALKIAPHGDGKKLAIVCDYTVEVGQRIKVKVAVIEGSMEKAVAKVKEKIPVGLEFSFKWAVKDDTAKFDDIKGEGDVVEHLKNHLEGDYEKKK